MQLDVYVYGMTVLSTIHRCAAELPLTGGYAEITETHVCPGGEAMNAAMLLSGLGLRVGVAGPHWGATTHDVLHDYARRYQIDVSGVTFDPTFAGLRDLVLVGGVERAVLGWFGDYFSDSARRWGEPDANAIAGARVVAIDPYFPGASDQAARFARAAHKPYVTIDCPYDSELHQHAAATVISREYRRRQYPAAADDALFGEYTSRSAGLSVFTAGSEAIRFGRAGAVSQQSPAFRVSVKSTLGAGDTFRAGVVFGVLRGFDDRQCVRFASGLAALSCTRLPIADNVPSLADVEAFLDSH